MPPNSRQTDTTVYTVYAGYVPTVAYKQDDFAFGDKHGKITYQTKNGTRYSGSLLNYGMGLAKDGSIRHIGRIPGSIAWFEYSTSIRAVNTQFENEEALAELARDQATEWYGGRSQFASGFNKEQESDALLTDVSRNLGFQPTTEGSGEEIEGSGGRLSKNPRPEERDPGNVPGRPSFGGQTMGGWDEGGTIGGMGAGRAKGIDLYIRNMKGDIIRLDVTERSMSDPNPHHGLPDFQARQNAQVTAEQLLDMTTAQQHAELLSFFSTQQERHWNPMIANLVNHVEQHGSQASQGVIRALQAGQANLHNMTDEIQLVLREARGGGDGTSPSGASGPGSKDAARRMLRSIPGRAAQNTAYPQRNMSNFAHMESVLVMALHHLGNVVRNFATGANEKSMTSYPLTPQGSYDASYVVGVMHRTFETGPQVFQFMPLEPQDVVIANEAHMSHHYMRQYWLQGVQDQDGALRTAVRHQNLLDASAMVSGNLNVIEEGTLYGLAQEDNAYGVKVNHSASLMIAPEHINADIDAFIQNLVAGNTSNMHAFLKNKIRNVSSLTSYRNPNAATRRGQIDPNFNPRGGPMLTHEINASIREFQREGSGVPTGAYADWLAASGAMDLTPEQRGFHGSGSHSSSITLSDAEGMFDYDMMGYRGLTGSSGMQQYGGRARTASGSFNSAATYGPNTNVVNIGRTRSTGYGMRTTPGATTSQDYVVGHRGRPSAMQRVAAMSILNRAIGGDSSKRQFLTGSEPWQRIMGANMMQGLVEGGGAERDWQSLARNMDPRTPSGAKKKLYGVGEYEEKSRQAGWGTPNEPQLWAAPYVSIYYPPQQGTVVDRTP